MAVTNITYGTWTAMTVTNLQSLATDSTDPYAGWQSGRVDNQTTVKAMDYEVQILCSTAATAPAGGSILVVYAVPWGYDGATWTPKSNFSTTTRPTGTEGTAIMSDPNSMKWCMSIPYKITSQPLDGGFFLDARMGGMHDGWSLAIRNETGAALGTGCVVSYRAITYTSA
jgi:hypothetical protein